MGFEETMDTPYLTATEAAAYLRKSVQALYALISAVDYARCRAAPAGCYSQENLSIASSRRSHVVDFTRRED